MYSALSLFLPVLFGMGWLVLHLHPALVRKPPNTRQNTARLLSLTLMLGLLCNYAIVLIVGSLWVSFGIGAVMAVAGLYLAARKRGMLRRILGLSRLAWLAIIVLAALYAVLVLFIPVTEWDARSIWFFHGKMIYYNGQTINATAGWDQPFANFSHVGYPELAPVLFAQFAAAGGFWNEFLPKAGLLALLVPVLIGLFAFFHMPGLSGIYLLVMALFNLGAWLWNGYMDGYLALYAAFACLFLARWLSTGDQFDALSGVLALAMAVSLKNEGNLLVLCTMASLAVVFLFQRRSAASLRSMLPSRTMIIAAVAFLGPLVWQVLIRCWGLPSETPSSPMDLQLIGMRLQQGAGGTIASTLLLTAEVAKAVAILACTLIACWFIKKRIPAGVWFTALTAVLYGSAMFWIYLTTNTDLSWHLSTSATRTMLPVVLLIVAATFLCLFDLEEADEGVDRPPLTGTR